MPSMLLTNARIFDGYGADCLEGMQVMVEGGLIREVSAKPIKFTPLEILRQVTSVNAALLQQEGKLGCIKEDAHADLIVVDGDPLADIELLAASGRNLRLIMRAGEIVKNELK